MAQRSTEVPKAEVGSLHNHQCGKPTVEWLDFGHRGVWRPECLRVADPWFCPERQRQAGSWPERYRNRWSDLYHRYHDAPWADQLGSDCHVYTPAESMVVHRHEYLPRVRQGVPREIAVIGKVVAAGGRSVKTAERNVPRPRAARAPVGSFKACEAGKTFALRSRCW